MMQENVATSQAALTDASPVLCLTDDVLSLLEESIRKGSKIELVPLKKWQREHGMAFNVSLSGSYIRN